MILLVDIGNSRIKWASLADLKLDNHGAIEYQAGSLAELLDHHWRRFSVPQSIYISNVAGVNVAENISAFIEQRWQVTPVFPRVEKEQGGVTNAYIDINQLGIDRWLALIAAWNRYHAPVCVVDCGTAITIDAISADGQHLGGFILPGTTLMHRSLMQSTQGIRTDIQNEITLEFGKSTSECISNGIGWAVTAVIDKTVEKMIKEQGDNLCRVISGGFADDIEKQLAYKFDLEPHLVLNGLALLAGD